MYLLVVDDDPAFCNAVAHALRRVGYRVLVATDGAQALALVRQSPPMLALVDLMMPGVNGLELLLVLKGDAATRHMPVIVWSATDTAEITKQAMAFEADAMLYKTRFSMLQLRKLIRKLVNKPATADDPSPMHRVLIVDDNDDTREALQKHLSGSGYTVSGASNGWEALLMLEREDIDLIILDLIMPGMDGQTFLRILRNGEKYQHIPVLIVTAYDVEEMKKVVGKLGIAGILGKKPPMWDDLLPAVRDALRAA